MELVGEVKRLLDERLAPKPYGYNVRFNAGAAAGGGTAVEAYRALRAELGRRPTPTELLHAGYLPLKRYDVIGRAWAISSAWACRT